LGQTLVTLFDVKLEPPPFRRGSLIRTDPAMPRLPPPPPPHRSPPERPLFDQLTAWAASDENRVVAMPIGFGLFCASILWLLYAIR
jgi:hypothetical protein